jgi:Fic family protein
MDDQAELQDTLQDLPPVDSFAPTGVGRELLSQIDEFLAEINLLRDQNRGLTPELVQRIEDQFLADRIRHSATIEGSTLDRRETLHVLTTGQIIEGKRRPSEEVRNLGEALRHAGELLTVDTVREVDIRDIHNLLLKGLDHHAGRYRPHDVRITNATYRPPEHLEVPRLMHQLVDNLRNAEHHGSIHGFIIGAYCHWSIARIHPFVDGNGRMARILQDLFFLRHRLVPAPIPFQQVDDYYEVLQQADAGNPSPFVEFLAHATLDSLQKYRAAIEEFRQTDDWLEGLIFSVNASVSDTEHAIYSRYMQRIGEFRETLRVICDKLSARVPEIVIRFRQFSGIDLTQFRQLKREGRAPRTWDFGIEFRYNDRSVRILFWHGRYHAMPSDNVIIPNTPVLLVSIEDDGTYRTLHDIGEQGISLRAVHVENGTYLRIRANPIEEINEFDSGMTAAAISRDFVQELLRSKLRIG